MSMSRFKEKLKHEVRELVPTTLFFFVGFELLVLTQALMLEQDGIKVTTFAAAAVGALVVAKVVLIADHSSFVTVHADERTASSVLDALRLVRNATGRIGRVVERGALTISQGVKVAYVQAHRNKATK